MVRPNQVARGVRVKLNSNFNINSLPDRYLACEPVLFIEDSHVYNDVQGQSVWIKGGSLTNSGPVYLSEIDLEFPVPETPLYSHETIEYNKNISEFQNLISVQLLWYVF